MPETARLLKMLAKDSHGHLGPLLKEGAYTSTENDTLKLLLETHFPESAVAGQGGRAQPVPTFNTYTGLDWVVSKAVVTEQRIDWAVGSFAPFKSAGLDGVLPVLLQRGLEVLRPWLLHIFRASLALGHIPTPWRNSRVAFIPKPGRGNYSSPKDFRPISLTSFLMKTLERLVDRHIRDSVLEVKPLHYNQHAYSAGRSVETALHQLVHRIEKTLHQGELAMGVFLDIEGAFNNVGTQSIVNAVAGRGIEPTLVRWIEASLGSRIVTVGINDTSVEANVVRGCPQGGVLSPLLWSLVVDDLLQDLNNGGVYAQGYADDICILGIGKFANTVADVVQVALRRVEAWCEGTGLSVNPGKTELVLFTRRRRLDGLYMPRIGHTMLVQSSFVKYLGVTLDSKLNWQRHISNKATKARNALWACRRALGVKWGLKPRMVYWLYTSVIRPSLCFASIVWWPAVLKQNGRRALDSLQRTACLAISGAVRTTPLAALETLLGIAPLEIFIQGEACKAACRLRTVGYWANTHTLFHSSVLTRGVGSESIFSMISDYTVPRFRFDRKLKVYFPERTDWSNGREPEVVTGGVWFTDGSRTGDRTGAGWYGRADRITRSASLGNHSTVFQAEVYAITAAAREIKRLGGSGGVVTICSDSQAALKAIRAPRTTSKLVWDCQDVLEEISRSKQVRLVWVPGHSGIEGNERADALARRGAKTSTAGPEPFLGIPPQCIKTRVHKWTLDEHRRKWKGIVTGLRQSRDFIEGPDPAASRLMLAWGRKSMRAVIGMLTGHNNLHRHLNILGLENDPTCRLCGGEEESSHHILCHCDALASLRQRIFGTGYPGPKVIQRATLGEILTFVKASGFW